MVWVIGNVPGCCPVEIFAARLRTPAPLTGFERPGLVHPANDPDVVPNSDEDVEGALPRTLEAWIEAQKEDPDFEDCLAEIVDKAQLPSKAPPSSFPLPAANCSSATPTVACSTSTTPRFTPCSVDRTIGQQ